jgi:hypothetical protein
MVADHLLHLLEPLAVMIMTGPRFGKALSAAVALATTVAATQSTRASTQGRRGGLPDVWARWVRPDGCRPARPGSSRRPLRLSLGLPPIAEHPCSSRQFARRWDLQRRTRRFGAPRDRAGGRRPLRSPRVLPPTAGAPKVVVASLPDAGACGIWPGASRFVRVFGREARWRRLLQRLRGTGWIRRSRGPGAVNGVKNRTQLRREASAFAP